MKIKFQSFFLSGALFCALCYPLPSSWAAGSNEKELFIVAQRAFEDGFYDVSLRYVNQLLAEFPTTTKVVEARLLEGQCYFFKKQYVKAFAVFKELVAHGEYRDASLFWLGETYLKGGDVAKAREQYRQVIDVFPSSLYAPQAYYSLAWCYFQKGDYPSARKMFQALIDKFPSNNLSEDAAFKLGECDYNAAQYEGAVYLFNKYIDGHPRSPRLYEAQFNVAEAFYNLEQYDKALDAYQKARGMTKEPPALVASLVGTGWCQIKLQKYADALKSFDEADAAARAAKIPGEDILLGKANLFMAQEKFKDAEASYTELLTRFPASPRLGETYLGRANACYLANNFPGAVGDYAKVIALYAAVAGQEKVIEKARFGLAWTYLKSGDLQNAVAMFQAVADNTDDKMVKVSAVTQIADAYQQAGEMDKAVAVYDRILREMPDSPYGDHVQYRLGISLLKSGKIDPAIFAFQALKANYPRSKYIAESRYYLGMAYFRKKDWSSAVEGLTAFVLGTPPSDEFAPESRYILALAQFNLHHFDKAVAAFNEILRLYQDRPQVLQNAQVGLAKTYHAMGDTKEALKRFKDIVYRYPRTEAEIEGLLWVGQYNMADGLYQRAAELYAQGLADLPDTSNKGLLHFELGRACQALDKLDKALEQFRQVDPKTDPVLYPRAKLAIAGIFSKELDTGKAVDTYRGIIATSPEFKRDALMKIAQIYRRENRSRDELQSYKDALEADKGDSAVTSAQIQFSVGDAYEVLNDPDRAVEAYFKVPYLYVKDTPWVIKAYLRIARIYENKEDWDKAMAAYKKVADMDVEESKFANERMASIDTHRDKK